MTPKNKYGQHSRESGLTKNRSIIAKGMWPEETAAICSNLSSPLFTSAFQKACKKAANKIIRKISVVIDKRL